MEKIGQNSLVTLSVKIENQDGTLIDSSDELMYLHGSYGQIFQKVEELLDGKGKGDSFDILLAPEDAFGEYKESLVVSEPLDSLPEDVTVGMELDSEDDNLVWVVETIENDYALLNANHELAGISIRVYGEIMDVIQLSEDDAKAVLEMSHI